MISSKCVASFMECLGEDRLMSSHTVLPIFQEKLSDEFISKVVENLDKEIMQKSVFLKENEDFDDKINGVHIKEIDSNYFFAYVERGDADVIGPISIEKALFKYVKHFIRCYADSRPLVDAKSRDDVNFYFAEDIKNKGVFCRLENLDEAFSDCYYWRPPVCSVVNVKRVVS